MSRPAMTLGAPSSGAPMRTTRSTCSSSQVEESAAPSGFKVGVGVGRVRVRVRTLTLTLTLLN